MKRFIRFLRDEAGITALEYALIAALIAMVIVLAVTTVGDKAANLYNSVANDVDQATSD